jgi:hypothetical protein
MNENTETLPDIFRERHPAVAVQRFSEVATAIGSLIENRKLYVSIKGRKHVRIEGWQALGAPLGIFARVESSERIHDGDRWGYEAYAVAHRMGEEISAADAECWSDEVNWKGKDDFQVRSMAQTRACAKALRLALGFVMAMAGYEATPAEEMEPDETPARSTMPKGKPMKPSDNSEEIVHQITALNLPSGSIPRVLGASTLKAWEATGHSPDEALALCQKLADRLAQGELVTPAIVNTRQEAGLDQAIEHEPTTARDVTCSEEPE